MLHNGNFLSSRTAGLTALTRRWVLSCSLDLSRILGPCICCRLRKLGWNTEDACSPNISVSNDLYTYCIFLLLRNLFVDVSASVDTSGIPIRLYMLGIGILLAASSFGASNSQVMSRPTKSLRRMYTLGCCKVDSHKQDTLIVIMEAVRGC